MKKEKGKDPAFLFYSQDFLTGVTFMTDEQIGRYIKLLCLQHQKGHMTTEQIGKILQDDDLEVFEKFRQDSEGKWYNIKLDQEIEKRTRYSEYQTELANRRWNKDAKASAKDKAKDIPKDMPSHMPNVYLPAENENENEKFNSTIETSTPNRLFPNHDDTPVYNSLEDLYNDIN